MFKKMNDPKAGGKPGDTKPGKSAADLQSPPMVMDVMRRANDFTEQHGVDTQPGEVEVEVVMYARGMTLDRTIYREYDSAEGMKALSDVTQGRVPQDLLMKVKSQPASLIICDRREEEYVPERHRPPEGGVIGKVNLNVDFRCDEGQPSTTLQVRFHTDKDLKKITVNLSTKVSDLYDYIMACAPVNEEYTLMCGHPPQSLEDMSMTIEQLHLPNGTVIQQLIV